MPKPDATRPHEGKAALNRLNEELDAFDARRARPASPFAGGQAGAEGYRLAAGVIGGLLGGLGLGWFFDRIAHTAPWGLVSGVLIGLGASIYSAVRFAGRMNAQASEPTTPSGDDGNE